ncbi:MAG: hypothetical protein H3C38_07150 [Rhodospirillales bacterium]|nr:hypothetical protein [Rhodospirillales bacterium]
MHQTSTAADTVHDADAPPRGAPEASLLPEATRLFSLLNPPQDAETGLAVQIIASRPGEGVSTVARDFARVAASHFDKPTLLLDLDWAGDGQWRHFSQPALVERLGPLSDPLDLGFDGSALIRVATHDVRRAKASITFHQVGATPLLVSRFHTDSADRRQVPQVTSNQAIWKQLRDRVGFIVVDSPAASTSFDGVAISGVMDAVVIVIEAETTRVPVIEDLRDKLMARGANVVGAVFNKRRMYIPKVLYKRL